MRPPGAPTSLEKTRAEESVAEAGKIIRDGPQKTVKYCIVTSIRDEEEFIAGTIESVLSQTIRPVEWIIVNDGSTDRTGAIIDEYARQHSWIRPVHRENRGFRSTGGGAEGFALGAMSLQCRDWEFLVNLDGDLTFSPDYFENCFECFEKNPRLGIAGGTIYNKIADRLEVEQVAKFHVRGATKIYRRQCWEKLGGVVPGLGWDTIDEVKANMHGWNTQSFPGMHLIHHRMTGTAGGKWWGFVKDGLADYIVGYHPLFFAAKCLRKMLKPPYLIGACGLCYGFVGGYVRRKPRAGDQELIRYVRRQQLNRLLGAETIWK